MFWKSICGLTCWPRCHSGRMWERLKSNLKSSYHESVSNKSWEFGEQIDNLLLSPASGHQSVLVISIRLLSLDLFVLLRYCTVHLRWREGGGRGQNTFRISVQTFRLQISRPVEERKGWMLENQVLMIIFIHFLSLHWTLRLRSVLFL